MAMYKGFSVTQERPPHNIAICCDAGGFWGHMVLTEDSCGWIDLTGVDIFVNPRASVPDVKSISPYMAFCNYVYKTVIPFRTEEELHMAILKYPELFTDMKLLSIEEVFGT